MIKLRDAACALMLAAGLVTAPRAQTVEAATPSWRQRTVTDIAALRDAMAREYIYAVYPNPAAFRLRLAGVYATAQAESAHVHDLGGYQAVLQHFVAQFHDDHVGVRFTAPAPARWPGFLVRYDNGRYRVFASRETAAPDGAEVTSCDGEPAPTWVERIAALEVGLPARLETTRMSAAQRLLLDRGSPLRASPRSCVVDGRAVALAWRTAPMAELNPKRWALLGVRDGEVSTTPLADGAWVRLGYFQPRTAEQARAFHAAIDAAPTLRDKRFIVLDVRGNGGGPYKWFMAYLRGLYGADYADYYATARLHIRGVYRLTRAVSAADAAGGAQEKVFDAPHDPPFEINDAWNGREEKRATAAGEPYFRVAPLDYARAGPPPPDPVHGQVVVLTDYGCGSACIGFVDELKRFPGVRQIGLPTAVDSRSGTPLPVKLPSGQAEAYVAVMTRDGRERDDNVAQDPSARFNGDIADDAAVRRWVLGEVVKP